MTKQTRLATENTAPTSLYQEKVVELLVQVHGYSHAEAHIFTHASKQGILRYEELAVEPSIIAKRLADEIPQRRAAA